MGIFDSIKDALTGHDKDHKEATPTPADVPFDPTLDAPSAAPSTTTTDPAVTTDPAAPASTAAPGLPDGPVIDANTQPAEEPMFEPTEAVQPEAQPMAPEAAAPAPAPQAETYTVEEGDNLTWIGERYGVSVDDLVRANNIENPDLIFPGQVLTIPR